MNSLLCFIKSTDLSMRFNLYLFDAAVAAAAAVATTIHSFTPSIFNFEQNRFLIAIQLYTHYQWFRFVNVENTYSQFEIDASRCTLCQWLSIFVPYEFDRIYDESTIWERNARNRVDQCLYRKDSIHFNHLLI